MTRRILPVALLTLALLAPQALAKEEAPGPFRDVAKVEKLFAEACDAVEVACGAKFKTRPTVQVSDRAKLTKILAREFAQLAETVMSADEREGIIQIASKAMLGKYEIGTHTVHVFPDNLETIYAAEWDRGPLGVDELRVLLAHEATHALDFERFPSLEVQRQAIEDPDAMRGLSAAIEGHAEFVAQRIATTWKVEPAFEKLGAALSARPKGIPELMRGIVEVAIAEIRFGYEKGLEFFQAVDKARGREGVEQVLRTPPTNSRQVENPMLWLDPASQKKPLDVKRLTQAFKAMVPGNEWRTIDVRLLKSQLTAMTSQFPEAHRARFAEGYADGHVFVANHPDDMQITIVAIAFDAEPQAVRFHAASLAKVEAAETLKRPGIRVEAHSLTQGAGKDNALHGFVADRTVHVGPTTTRVVVHAFTRGPLAFEMMFTDLPAYDRAVQDAFIEYGLAVLDDPDARHTAPAAPEVTSKRRTLAIQVVDPTGKPVPSAQVSISTKGDSLRQFAPVEHGEALQRTRRGPGRVDVYDARDARGHPLPFGPASGDFDETQTEVQVTLAAGVPLAGRIVDPEGQPAAGVEVTARTTWRNKPLGSHQEHGTATTDAAGRFRIPNLGPYHYELLMKKGEKLRAVKQLMIDLSKPEQRTIDIQLKVTSSFTITVLDPDGKPLRSVHVYARASGASSEQGTTDHDGKVMLEGLDPKQAHRLSISPSEHRNPEVADMRLHAWMPANQAFRLKPGWSLRGTVVDENGKAIAGKIVHKRGSSTHSMPTKKDGSFVLANLPKDRPLEVSATTKDDDMVLRRQLIWLTVKPGTNAVQVRITPPAKDNRETVEETEEIAPDKIK